MPAITICPEGLETNSTYRKFISGNHKTFWDFSTKIKPLEKYLIKGRPNSFIWNGKNRYGKLENDITVTDFATVNYKNEMVRCMTLTFVNPKMTEDRLAVNRILTTLAVSCCNKDNYFSANTDIQFDRKYHVFAVGKTRGGTVKDEIQEGFGWLLLSAKERQQTGIA